MNIVIDTNVLSEMSRTAPDANVLRWLAELDEDRAFVSVVTLGELRRGVLLLDPGRRRDALTEWLSHEMLDRFAGRVLPVDAAAAEAWAELMAESKRNGLQPSPLDGFIAASALSRGMALATRNVRDFVAFGVELVNPWEPI